MGWIDRAIDRRVDSSVRKYMQSDEFHNTVKGALIDAFARAPGAATPKNRSLFGFAMLAHLIHHHKWTPERAEEMIPFAFADLERECAPWGHPDYSWQVSAARDWIDDWSEDR